MKQTIFICAGAGLLFYSCATTLDKSEADRFLRFEGSYTCPKSTNEPIGKKETLAEADVSRVRCARDSWAIQGQEIFFARSLYQTSKCEVPLGRIQFKAKYFRTERGVSVQPGAQCEVVRTNAGWIGERSGKCLMKDFSLNHAYPIRNKNCHAYIPSYCKNQDTHIELNSLADEAENKLHGPLSEVSVTGADKEGVCKRYAAD